jgi:hypothetical protein
MKIVNRVREHEWDEFLQNYASANVYHTPEWKKVLEKTFNYRSDYLFCLDDCDVISGLLPIFRVRGLFTGTRLCCLPFSHICPPIGENFAIDALIEHAIDLCNKTGPDFLEVRSGLNSKIFTVHTDFYTHILNISGDVEQIWNCMDRGSVRWAIKKSKNEGISVISSSEKSDMKQFYDMNCKTKKDLGVPCHPYSLFKSIFEIMPNNARLYIAKKEGEAIGGGIMLYFNKKVLYGYGAAEPEKLRLQPYYAFIWKSIQDAHDSGYGIFDFGRTSKGNYGLISFKRRWGTKEIPIYYSIYSKDRKKQVSNRDGAGYRLASRIIRLAPSTAYKKFSDAVFGHLG